MALALVDEALQDIELLGIDFVATNCLLRDLQAYLRHLRTFLFCAMKRHNHMRSESNENTSSSSLGSFLSRIEDAIIENGKDFHSLCNRQKSGIRNRCFITDRNRRSGYRISWIMSHDMVVGVCQFLFCVSSFTQEIIESYVTLSNCCSLKSMDQSMVILDSLLVIMEDIRDRVLYGRQHAIESLIEKLVFFKNFIRFAELRGFEPSQLQVLFTHLELVAMNAAGLCLDWASDRNNAGKELCDKFQFKFSELLQKIRPIDPQIRDTFVQVLKASNLSGSPRAPTLETDKHVFGDFLDSLLYIIEEALTYDDDYMVALKDQVPIFYEGTRFLRTILTKHMVQIDELHEKVKDLIGAAVNEAGIVICSLLAHELKEVLAKEMDFSRCNFLEKIRLIKVITSVFVFPRTDVFGFMDFLLENLKELPSCKVDSISFAKDQIQRIQEGLVSIRSFLGNGNHDQDRKFRSLGFRVVEVAYKVPFVILSSVIGDIPDCSALKFVTIAEEINLIKTEGLKIADVHYSPKVQNPTNICNPSPSEDGTVAINKGVVTLEDEETTIRNQLTGGPKHLDIVSIVGMPGLGKTTLARSVYDDPSIRSLFHARAWCVVSQVYIKKDLLCWILSSVDCDFSNEYSKKNEHELEEKLKKCLLKRRYLIVLDDVWDVEAWSSLERSFPNDSNSSRILITSRQATVAKKINPNREPHSLRRLTDDESWFLLHKKLSGKEDYPIDLGRKIAKNCKGLPLTIVIMAGILENLEQDGWKEIAGRRSSSVLSVTEECMQTLELSYKKLPDYLKSCLLYFGAFAEDKEIHFRRLIWLWIAEGFVKICESKSLHDVAKDYMHDLIGRGLVMVSRKGSLGGVKTCRIHDLLHEFCVIKAKKEKFMSLLIGRDGLFSFHEQRNLQRLSVHSTQEHFVKSRLFCPGVRSLLFFVDDNDPHHYCFTFIFHLFKLLKVLDLIHISLGSAFPSEITFLVELRYLAIKGHFPSIPPAIADLQNLETLHVDSALVSLPNTLWNMLKLRVIRLSAWLYHESLSYMYDLERSSGLLNLDTFSEVFLSLEFSIEKVMRKLPNIRRLKCKFFNSLNSNFDCNKIVAMDFLSRLESLHVRQGGGYRIRFCFPLNLKKLSVSGFHSSIIPKSGELANLIVLKLDCIDFDEDTWDMEELEFPKLKILEMTYLKIVRWMGSNDIDHFPHLQKLVLVKLKEVPSCLENVSSLRMIEVRFCSKSVASLLQKIMEELKNSWGMEDIQMSLQFLF